jgi:hypothetical protein
MRGVRFERARGTGSSLLAAAGAGSAARVETTTRTGGTSELLAQNRSDGSEVMTCHPFLEELVRNFETQTVRLDIAVNRLDPGCVVAFTDLLPDSR